MSNTLEELKQAIVEGEDDDAIDKTNAALDLGIAPMDILNQAAVSGIQEAGQLWNENRFFLPDIVLSAGAFRAVLDIVEPLLSDSAFQDAVRILIGTVEGDMHDLGKNIVITMLRGAGFKVIDLGVDVPTQTFVEKIQELEPEILGLGAYMTTTMLVAKEILEALDANNLREKVKVIVGGIPMTQNFADEIGAEAWGKDALDAVDKVKRLLEVK